MSSKSLGGRKIIRLPMGYVENGTLSDEIEIRAMKGTEEDILSDDKIPMSRRLNDIVSNCTERIGTVTDKDQLRKMIPKLSTDDQTAILIGLRAISVDNEYKYVLDCPSCTQPIKINLDLDTLESRPAKAKEGFPFEVTLPSGRKAKVRPMLIEDTGKTENLRLEGEGRVSASIWVRLVELDGKADVKIEDVKELLYADRVYLREFFDVMEGGLESELKIKCVHCGRVFTSYLDIARIEFFSPKMMS